MARKGILNTDITPKNAEQPAPRQRMMPSSAVGALQSSLTKLQENAVQDIDASLIDNAGMEDRLGFDQGDQEKLKESLKTYGQQVPVLLRPHPTERGRFEIVYGRRRLAALRDLGMPVKAMVRQLDDHALVMAQGQENNTRTDLSFIEKSSFAAQLKDAGYERQAICDALAIDMPMVSRMLRVGEAFDLAFLRRIGRAPSIGRDRWMKLSDLMIKNEARTRIHNCMNRPDFALMSTDERFEAVFLAAQGKRVTSKPLEQAPARKTEIATRTGDTIATVKATDSSVNISVKEPGFRDWLESHADELVRDWYAQWQAGNR